MSVMVANGFHGMAEKSEGVELEKIERRSEQVRMVQNEWWRGGRFRNSEK